MIRLFRVGKKKQPAYKIIVTDKRNAPARGRFVEEVGVYNPLTKEVAFKKERIIHWLGVGAQASDTVHNLLIKNKVIEAEKRKMTFKKKEEPVAEEKPAEKETATEEKPVEAVEKKKPAETEVPKEEAVAEEKPVEAEDLKEEIAPEEKPVEASKEESVEEKPTAQPEETAQS